MNCSNVDSIIQKHSGASQKNNRNSAEHKNERVHQDLQFNNVKDAKTKSSTMNEQRTNVFYCLYCKVNFCSDEELKAHCSTESHQLAITKDDDKKWGFRPPPRGLKRKHLTLCHEINTKGSCRLGDQCLGAHSEPELAEWQERMAYREWKVEQARQEDLSGSSYAEQLLERWVKAINPESVLAESLEGVSLQVEPKLFATFSAKNSSHAWTLMLKSKFPLHVVSLLYDSHRKYFKILSMTSDDKAIKIDQDSQEWYNSHGSSNSNLHSNERIYSYVIKIRFETDIFGTFRQTLVLDFGIDPVIEQKLCVDVVPPADLAQLQEVRETILCVTERWNSTNTLCVPFENKAQSYSEQDLRLFNAYPIPNPATFVITQAVASPLPNESMYKSRFHELLYIEEMAQYNLIARFNVSSKLQLVDSYILAPGTTSIMKYAQKGELYACMKLSSEVSEDLPAGRMIQTNCSSVFLAPIVPISKKVEPTLGRRKVFEAIIEDKGKKMIYLRLPKQCVTEFNLKPDREYVAEVQFQLNRMPFCEMHYSVDGLGPVGLVFPEVEKQIEIPPANPKSPPWDLSLDERLNPKQKEAITAICAPNNIHLPPILIIGPFGTGKTFTLAQAVKAILKNPENRVLVCTHSNSAADIYIREYLHPFVEEGHPEAEPLRVYYQHRWVATVHPTVLQYCLINEKESTITFRLPTVEDLEKRKIVVTTLSSSRYLVNLNLSKKFFTHILIDEAAQAMESEAIMPLALAGMETRIALAGDHMQLSPEVYSPFAQEKNLQLSLLERLFDLYKREYPCKILLCENYRSHKAIVQYTSDMFYQNSLLASKDQPKHKTFYPLTFFTARGEDVQDTNSTAYYNNSEVYEVAERVLEIHKSWPTEWGPQNDANIGVVTPYHDQVVRIRTELRKRKLHHVSVERVLNVQGKQFRAIVLSTVRTLQTCTSGKSITGEELDYGFLSNARLLNTAITRGQSLVAVVGDPVSLCSMGKCRKLWEKFIRICYDNDSLYGISWQTLQTQLDGLELKKTYMLNPLAPEFIPRRMRMKALAPSSISSSSSSTNSNVANGCSGFFGTPPPPQNYGNQAIAPPCYPNSNVNSNSNTQIPQQDGIPPMYSLGPFPDPYSLSYPPYMGMPFPPPPPHFMPVPYNAPPYGYPPWWMGNKSGNQGQPSTGISNVSNSINPVGVPGNRDMSKLASAQRAFEKAKTSESFTGENSSLINSNSVRANAAKAMQMAYRNQLESNHESIGDEERALIGVQQAKRMYPERFLRMSEKMKLMDPAAFNALNGSPSSVSRTDKSNREFKNEAMLTNEQKQRLCFLEAFQQHMFTQIPRRNSLEGGAVNPFNSSAATPNPVGSQRNSNPHVQDLEENSQMHQSQQNLQHQNQMNQEGNFPSHYLQQQQQHPQERFINSEEYMHHHQQQQQSHMPFHHPRMFPMDGMPMKGFNNFDGMNGTIPPMMAGRHPTMNHIMTNEMNQEQFNDRFHQRYSGNGAGDPFAESMPSENGFPRRRSLPSNHAITLEQLEAVLLAGGTGNALNIPGGNDAVIQRGLLMQERNRQMPLKMREEQSYMHMNGFSENYNNLMSRQFEDAILNERMSQMSLNNAKLCNGGMPVMTNNERGFAIPKGMPIPDHQLNSITNQTPQSPLLHKETTVSSSPSQDYALEKLLQVSQKVWAEPVVQRNSAPQQQISNQAQQQQQQPPTQSVFGRALSENELFERHQLDRVPLSGMQSYGSYSLAAIMPNQQQQHQELPQHHMINEMKAFRQMSQMNGPPIGMTNTGAPSMFGSNLPPNMMGINGGGNMPLSESRFLGHMTNGSIHSQVSEQEPPHGMMNGVIDKSELGNRVGGGGGFNLFQHKTILTNDSEENKGLYSNVF